MNVHEKQNADVLMSLIHLDEKYKRSKDKTPVALRPIRYKFKKAMETNTPVLVENADLSSPHSVVIDISYIGERYCMGYQTILYYGQEIKVPHTIHYTDVYGQYESERRKNKGHPRIIFYGDDPFKEEQANG